MSKNASLKEAYEIETKYGAFYTGGNVEYHAPNLFCQTATSISVLNTATGAITSTIGETPTQTIDDTDSSDPIQTFTTDGTAALVTAHKSGLLKLWHPTTGALAKTWKCIHRGPIARLLLAGDLLATGGSDSSVRLWHLPRQTCTLNLKAAQGVVSIVEIQDGRLYASGDDGKIHSFDLGSGGRALTAYNAHYSKVTALVFANTAHFITSARDKVVILWKIGEGVALKTIPTHETIESIVLLPAKIKIGEYKTDPDELHIASGGENAIIRVWNVTKAKQIAQHAAPAAITKILPTDAKTMAVVTVDHNIILYTIKSFVTLKQFIGFSDEILDVVFLGANEDKMAVATNSPDIKLYETSTMNCQLLTGHTDIVLSLAGTATKPDLLLSASKDNQIRLWRWDGVTMAAIAAGLRHTGSVGTVAFSASDFFVSGAQDNCLKVWSIPDVSKVAGGGDLLLDCVRTAHAHDKDINCVSVSPNDKIIASASQDKTVKLWTDELMYVGCLRGHRRGVWCVRFSPVDQVVVTSSADCTIKLWSVAELQCLKTLEGHESSVLRAEFLSNGMQIITAGSDGLLKLFSVKSGDCVATFDGHSGRIWTLAVRRGEGGMVTGGSDSVLVKWRDVSEARRLERVERGETMALEEQQLANFVQEGELLKALKLALRLERPSQVLRIVGGVIRAKGGEDSGLVELVRAGLRDDEKEALLKCALHWNMNGRHCQAAQLVLNVLVNEMQGGGFRPAGFRGVLEGALPYTERHFKRLTQLLEDLYFVNYTVHCMQPHYKPIE